MTKHPFDDETLNAALQRLVDGEPEPGDDALLSQAMREHPDLLREVSGMLALDHLLRQQHAPADEAFVDAVSEEISDEADDPFIRQLEQRLPEEAPMTLRWPRALARRRPLFWPSPWDGCCLRVLRQRRPRWRCRRSNRIRLRNLNLM